MYIYYIIQLLNYIILYTTNIYKEITIYSVLDKKEFIW